MTDKPTYLRASVDDWKADRISLERLCEIWGISFYAACRALSFGNEPTGGQHKHPEAIEEILKQLK